MGLNIQGLMIDRKFPSIHSLSKDLFKQKVKLVKEGVMFETAISGSFRKNDLCLFDLEHGTLLLYGANKKELYYPSYATENNHKGLAFGYVEFSNAIQLYYSENEEKTAHLMCIRNKFYKNENFNQINSFAEAFKELIRLSESILNVNFLNLDLAIKGNQYRCVGPL